jgi:hypothetical protein
MNSLAARISRGCLKCLYGPVVLRRCLETTRNIEGLVIGVYEGNELTRTGEKLDMELSGLIRKNMELSKIKGKENDIRVFYNLSAEIHSLALVGLGNISTDELKKKEICRKAVRK